MTFALTAFAGLFAADSKSGDAKKVPPIRAKVVLTATVGGAGSVGFAGAVQGAGFGGQAGGVGVGSAPNLGIFGAAGGAGGIGGAGGKVPAQNLGIGGGVFGVLGGGMGFNGAPPKVAPQMDLFLDVGADSGKTVVLATVPNGKATEWVKKYWANNGWVFAKQRPVFAFTGRVTTEDEDKLFPNAAPVINGPVTLELAEKKRLVFVIESVTAVDKFNKDKYPPQGQASVEGTPACAKDDLKLLDTETLAVANDPVPVVVPGKKHDDETRAAKKIKATGVLAVADGKLRLQETGAVKVIEKK
jgi:hypothetical protein